MSRAQEWVEHLRAGGTATWLEWRTAESPSRERATVVPGAQQLELLRRLNLHRGGGELPNGLTERVLAASAPGRGTPDLDLVDNGPPPEFGPAPVEPHEIRFAELSRVAAGLVAEDVMRAEHTDATPRAQLTADRYTVAGDPWISALWQRDANRRRVFGGSYDPERDPVIVVATDPATALANLWTTRAFGHGIGPWRGWLHQVRSSPSLPARADPSLIAARWAKTVGAPRVHVVTDPRQVGEVAAAYRRPKRAPETPSHLRPTWGQAEVARRVGASLGLHMHPDRRRLLLRTRLLNRLSDTAASIPDRDALAANVTGRRGWLDKRAAEVTRRLRRGGYAVHGDLEDLRGPGADLTGPRPEAVLRQMLDLLASPADPPPGGGR